MTHKPFTLFAVPFLALAACDTAAIPAGEDACGASALQDLVDQPADRLATMRFVAPMRVLRPNSAATMDHRPERINIAVDNRGVITSVTCG
ncbi:MAG: I78 family peptidase inhibitor [Paracoccaceae bacterium]